MLKITKVLKSNMISKSMKQLNKCKKQQPHETPENFFSKQLRGISFPELLPLILNPFDMY